MITLDLAHVRPAVLVIDMQAVFLSPDGPFSNHGAEPMIGRLNAFLDNCRERALPVVFAHYLLRGDLADAGLLADNPAAVHFTSDAPLAGLDPRVRRRPEEREITHNRPGCFHGSELADVLGALGADAVVLTGVSVNNAISTTAREAFARDVPALVVRDCVGLAPWEPADLFDSYVDALGTWTAEVASAAEVLERLG